MKLLSILNPQKWIGQMAVLACFFFMGSAVTLWHHKCPATTQINNDIKNKKGTLATSNNLNTQSQHNCIEWLRGQSMRQIKELRK